MTAPDLEYKPGTDSLPLNIPSRPERSFLRHAASMTLIVAAIIVLFWSVFFLGETLIDVNTLNNQLPWGYSAGQSDYPYNRRDLTDTYVTRDYFVVSAYRDGEFPLWNPYTMAGHPIYADGVTRTLSPLLLFYKVFDVPLGYSIARITELMLAAVFMYLFLIGIGATASGGLTGSLAFAFSAHSMFHLTGLGWWGGLMWLPLIFLFVDRAIRRPKADCVRYSMLAGVFLATQFFCGYLPNQIYYVGAVALYYLFFATIERRVGGDRCVGRALAMMLVTLTVGLALSATQWAPSLELLSYSNRKIVGAELGYVWLPPWYAGTLVFPNLFGSAYDVKMLTLFTGIGVSHDHSLYLGIAALVPLAFSVYWLMKRKETARLGDGERKRHDEANPRRHILFFTLLAALSLIIMMAAPLYISVTRYVPILQVIRVAVRAGVLFLFAASTLAALGTGLLLESSSDTLHRFFKLARRFAILTAAFVALAVVASFAMKVAGLAIETNERGRLGFIRNAASALSAQFTPPNLSILVSLGLLFITASLIWAFASRRLNRSAFVGFLVALLIVDLFWNGQGLNPKFDRSRVFPKTEITDLLHSLPPGRVLVVPSELETNRSASAGLAAEKIIAPPNTLLSYQIPTVTGKNQQFPKWYREYASLVEPQPNLSHVVFDQYRSRFFDLLNVRYVMTHESTPLPDCELLATAEGVSLYQNKNAMPRAFFVHDVIGVGDGSESLKVLSDDSSDPRTMAVIETGNQSTYAPFPAHVGEAAIVEDGRNKVVIETTNNRDGLLVLSDNYYPGWRAYIDGVRTEVFKANHTMRAVNVPAGRHVISFVFRPAIFFASIYVSLSAAALTLIVLIISAVKRKRSNGHDLRQD
jgi:Bacterial membrane protein YfhO